MSLRTPELEAEIVARLSKGEPLAVICRDEHMPCDDTVRNWQDADPAFARAIARAREAGFDAIANRTRATARKPTCASEAPAWNSPDTNHREANRKSQITRAAKNSRADQLLRKFD